MIFFRYILFEIHLASWICRLMSFAKYGKFSAIISLNSLSVTASFFLWDSDVRNIGPFVTVTQVLETLFFYLPTSPSLFSLLFRLGKVYKIYWHFLKFMILSSHIFTLIELFSFIISHLILFYNFHFFAEIFFHLCQQNL